MTDVQITPPLPIEARFWAKADKRGPDECWAWTAACTSKGYGRLWVDGTMDLAHRVAYRLFVGPIPEGHEIDHLCRSHGCVNPAHLEAVTHAENVRRGLRGVLLTHCVNGHEFNETNTLITKAGKKSCRPCNTERARGYREARRAA